MSSSRESYKNAINDDQECGSDGKNVTLNKEGTYNESEEATDNDGEMQLDARDHSVKVENGCGDMNSPEFSNHADTLCISIKIFDDSIKKRLRRKPLCLICGPHKGILKTEYTKLSSYPDVEKEIRGLLKILSPPRESDACCGSCLGVMKDFLAMKRKIIALHVDAQVDLPDSQGDGESGEDQEMSDGENMSCNTNNQDQNSEVLIKHEIIDISFGEDNDHSKERESLKNHEGNGRKTLYLKPKVYHCSYCERTFNRANTHALHERSHTGETNYKCEYCELSFTRATDLKEHGRVHELKCSYCGKSCWGPKALKRHELDSHISKLQQRPKIYKCSYCDKIVTKQSALTVHEMIHTDDRLKCKHCEKSFTKRDDLLEHDKIHELKCSHCGKSCWGTKALSSHERIHACNKMDSSTEVLKCSFCDKTFN
ncbi:zinc finger protein 239-like [Lingula anatina]|uniref:Zinc finger protein 239-like n=1 Tax=Lingula anatina TaxID=7574 RepID=A0A1S3KHD5_LINAN|nr:zinc finger protein 239-like [Lingula anatina]|eukprot:XP_013421631.1 zinc finger protein 239-like [Lingula anatina]